MAKSSINKQISTNIFARLPECILHHNVLLNNPHLPPMNSCYPWSFPWKKPPRPLSLRWLKWLCPLYYGMTMMALSVARFGCVFLGFCLPILIFTTMNLMFSAWIMLSQVESFWIVNFQAKSCWIQIVQDLQIQHHGTWWFAPIGIVA